jgi:DNA-binding MurR/RpiR family transcriptional regulator
MGDVTRTREPLPEPLLFNRIRAKAPALTRTQARIADYVLRDCRDLAHSSASVLGKKIRVSSSALVRFAQTLGFSGYPEMQTSAQEVISHNLSMVERFRSSLANGDADNVEKILHQDLRNLERTAQRLSRKDLREAARVIASADRVFVVGYRNAAAMSILVSSTLGQLTHNIVQLSFDYGETLDKVIGLGERDVLIALAFPRYSRRTLQYAAHAKRRKATLVALTDVHTSPLAAMADHAFFADVNSTVLPYSYAGVVGLINAIVVAVTEALAPVASERLANWEEVFATFEVLDGMKRESSERETARPKTTKRATSKRDSADHEGS